MRQERDEWLMAQVALGRQDALEILLRRYASPLLTFIRRMIGDHHRSEELFQEVFLAIWQKRHQYKMTLSFRGWLYAIALNTCRAEFRRVRLTCRVLQQDEVSSPGGCGPAGELLISTEDSTLVLSALRRLPMNQRAVAVLRIWSGLSYAEIAAALGRREGTVRAHMHHALISLRECMESHRPS